METTLPFGGSDLLPSKLKWTASWLNKEKKNERKKSLVNGLGSTVEVKTLANFFIGVKENK